jgi:hypothetical protein
MVNLGDITGRTCQREEAEAAVPQAADISAGTRWLSPKPRKQQNWPSRRGQRLASSSPFPAAAAPLHQTPSKRIARPRMIRMDRARQLPAKACEAAPRMDEARAWRSARMDEAAPLLVVAARFNFPLRSQAQMQALRDKATIFREEEALLDIIETRLEISRATGGTSLPSNPSRSSRARWGISRARNKAVSSRVTVTVLL